MPSVSADWIDAWARFARRRMMLSAKLGDGSVVAGVVVVVRQAAKLFRLPPFAGVRDSVAESQHVALSDTEGAGATVR